LAVLLIDIDHFKDVNDRHGHLAGDFVLRELAAILRDRTRREECLARYGGEELCLVLPEAAREDAVRRGDDLRRACERHDFVFDDARIPVTFSGGVATMTAGMEPTHLLKAADERLYAAKRSGRNRIC
jgi:diguanylate cyclase (GGDEF)-like protein